MVIYCSVCLNNARKNKQISYFSFPKEYNRRKYWLEAVGREDLLLKLVDDKKRQQYRICEDHFERNCIKFSKKGNVKYLHDHAFPTLKLPTNEGASSSSVQENAFLADDLPSKTGAIKCEESEQVWPSNEELPSNEDESLSSIKCEDIHEQENQAIQFLSTSETSSDFVNNIATLEANADANLIKCEDTSEQVWSSNEELPSKEDSSSSSTQENAFPANSLLSNTGANLIKCEDMFEEEIQEILCLPTSEISSDSNNFISKIAVLEDQTALHLPADTQRKRKLKLELREAKKNKNSDLENINKEDFLKLCDKFMSKSLSQIIKWQIDVKAGYNENRHNLAFKFFALNLYYCGPGAYRFLANTLCLPPLATLQKLVMPIGTKTDERLLRALNAKVEKMGLQEKICSVCVDCMSVRANLCYDVRNDRIVGLHDINGVQKKEPAKYVIVMMIRGILHDWKQPIAHSFFSQRKNYTEINEWIDEIIISLLNIGLDIRVFVSDLDSDFIKPSKLRSVSSDKTYFEVHGHKIFYMFDVPHLMKCVRNNFKTRNLIFDGKVAKWSYITDLYNHDKHQQLRLAPKLTDLHINPNSFQKAGVKLATQVLSRTVASAIYTYVDLNLIDVAAKDTAVLINKLNNLFDILNSSTLRSPYKFKRAFRGDPYQIEFLQEMLSFFINLKLIRVGEQDVTNNMNFINGFQVSIKSLLQLSKDLKSEGIKFILTRRLNRDVIENFFDKVREADGNCQEPTCKKFSNAFKKVFITNILKKPQNINCNQDFDSVLMKPENCRIFNTLSQVSLNPQSDEDIGPGLIVGTSDYRFDIPEKNGLLYVSGYLYRKCLEQHNKCHKIKLYVKRSDQTANMSNDSLLIHDNDCNDGNVHLGFSIRPPDNFIAFVELLEQKFREYFELQVNIVNVGNEIMKRIEDCKFDMPCECFPLDYLKKLYVRFRIYYTIKRNNKLLKDKYNKMKNITVINF